MKVGIIGLGLIGGSMAKAYKRDPDWQVFGKDKNPTVTGFAKLAGMIDDELTEKLLCQLDLLLLGAYPAAIAGLLQKAAPFLKKDCVVMDLSGVKEKVCGECFEIADKFGFIFIGAHPMAGTHHSGLKYARENLFDGQPMVLVPPVFDDILLLDKAEKLLKPARFGRFSVITAKEHDEKIAFTSQMAHVVSNAFIKSPTALSHQGFSAGSYRDMTRVAWLNPQMWAELFLDNKENLLFEIDTFMASMQKYRDALAEENREELEKLLEEGRKIKEEVDGQ